MADEITAGTIYLGKSRLHGRLHSSSATSLSRVEQATVRPGRLGSPPAPDP